MRKRTRKEVVPGDERLGDLIRQLRQGRGKSLRDVAELLHSNRGRIGDIERGERLPEAGELLRLRTAFELNDSEWMALNKSYLEAVKARLLGPLAGHLMIADRTKETIPLKAHRTLKEIAISLGCDEPALLRAFTAARTDTSLLVSQRRRVVEEGLEAKVLLHYYDANNLAHGHLAPYSFVVNGQSIDVPVASRPDWCGLQIPLGGEQEQCTLVDAPRERLPISEDDVGHVYASLYQQKAKIWNDTPIYRVATLTANTNRLAATFMREEYFRHRFTSGLIIDELTEAVIRADFDVDMVLSRRDELLRLRRQLLPDGRTMLDFAHRICAIGVMTLFAMAHPDRKEFLIPLKRRSWVVGSKQGVISVMPQGFHQPTQEFYGQHDPEIQPSFSVLRELYEEVFKGEGVQRRRKHFRHDWFLDHRYAPMGWFLDHKDQYSLECTSCGIELASGDCMLGILFVIHDRKFWERYSKLLYPNWEFLEDVPMNTRDVLTSAAGSACISSQNRDGLAYLLQRPDWDPGGLVAFVEGLLLLKQIDSQRVNLPDIERLL